MPQARGSTVVAFGEPVPDEDLYGSAMLSCELQVRPEDLAHLPDVRAEAGEPAPVVAVSTVLLFKGGVTLDWVVNRIVEWDAMIASRSHKSKRRRSVRKPSGATVH